VDIRRDLSRQGTILLGVHPTIVIVSAVGLALKDHGRDGTLKGLCAVNPLSLAGVVGVPV